MASEKTTEHAETNGADDTARGGIVGVMNTAQGAAQATAGAVRTMAESAAERLPEAVSTAQEVATGTATTLDELPDQALVIGTSFSLGLGIGLFLTGAHRIFVILALAPAAAMAATLMNREPGAAEKARRAVRKRTEAINGA